LAFGQVGEKNLGKDCMMFKHAGTTLFQILVKSREYRIKFIKGIVVK